MPPLGPEFVRFICFILVFHSFFIPLCLLFSVFLYHIFQEPFIRPPPPFGPSPDSGEATRRPSGRDDADACVVPRHGASPSHGPPQTTAEGLPPPHRPPGGGGADGRKATPPRLDIKSWFPIWAQKGSQLDEIPSRRGTLADPYRALWVAHGPVVVPHAVPTPRRS